MMFVGEHCARMVTGPRDGAVLAVLEHRAHPESESPDADDGGLAGSDATALGDG